MSGRSVLSWIASRVLALGGRSRDVYALPERTAKPTGSKVLVLAPHPDDEVIGCGGTLLEHVRAGDAVSVAIMADGVVGDAFCTERGSMLAARRKREAKAAQAAMGTSEVIFLDYPDTRLAACPSAADDVVALLERLTPDILYVPSFMDAHVDHRATFDIAAVAVERYSQDMMVYLYEVFPAIPANCVVEIDIERKVACINLYESQLDEDRTYEGAVRSLAKYRAFSNFLGSDKSAECFWRCTSVEFLALARDVG